MAELCTYFHAGDAPYWENIYYWTTPTVDCLDGRTDVECKGFDDWIAAWTRSAAGTDPRHRPDQAARVDDVPGPALRTPAANELTSSDVPAPLESLRTTAVVVPTSPARACGSVRLLAAPVGWLVIAYLGALAADVRQRVLLS